jgi:SOS-response transcriptional repressor LexA
MDGEWFKKRQRALGVTSFHLGEALGRDRTVVSRILNGVQKMTPDQAQVFSQLLKVDLSEVMERAGIIDSPTAQRLIPGFADSDVAAWTEGQSMAETAAVRNIALAMGEKPGVDVWRVKSRAMALAGLLEGDFMLVDTHQSERTKPGDVVIAQIYSQGTASTVLRRFEPPVLVAASVDPADGRVHVVDHNNVAIRGKVVASWRL